MFNDKFTEPFVRFLNKNFNNDEHLVLCKRWFADLPFPAGRNVVEVKTFNGFDFGSAGLKKIVCHSFFDDEVVEHLYAHRGLLKKTYWVVWGGDLYDAKASVAGDFVRRNVCGCVATFDADILQQKYGITNVHFAHIPTPITASMIRNLQGCIRSRRDGKIRIQVNHSCGESTIAALRLLSKFKNENIEIVTYLSYGNLEWRERILKAGREIFGKKFLPELSFLKPEEFLRRLADNDILVMNHGRQQGVGNINASLCFGVKVYICQGTTVDKFYKNLGILVGSTESIGGLPFQEFLKNQNREENMSRALEFFDERKIAKQYAEFFESAR